MEVRLLSLVPFRAGRQCIVNLVSTENQCGLESHPAHHFTRTYPLGFLNRRKGNRNPWRIVPSRSHHLNPMKVPPGEPRTERLQAESQR